MTTAETRNSPATPQNLPIVPFAETHLPGALALSQAVGWPHRLEDWALMLSVSEGVAALDGDRVVGTAFCTVFGDVALINMIIVDSGMRGRGLGRRLMQAVMGMAGDREMRLVATEEGLPLYRKLGFAVTGRIAQHQGIAVPAEPALPVREGAVGDMARLAAMDRAASGLARTGLLERIAGQGHVLVAEGGFALLRDFGRGHVLGPVVARDPATARALIAAGASRCAGRFLRIDLPEACGLGDFAAGLGLAHAGGGTAMARGAGTPEASDVHTYALVSQALG
ncbi:GNAT family N-acetyltransferase [Kaustia mangrovi]|uniref:GNAT family N-acetyltransferase n=1 Tax=Kaustia mangrovi TaxID=2593653 RepID=A0A7S8HAK4_9HYPH|nr:GNAT family N-acetyltransferase [Kaustia mangrovi]QPC41536.1 GNAT family N-acetyltransferase [Kaustia mangrovi]